MHTSVFVSVWGKGVTRPVPLSRGECVGVEVSVLFT